VYSGTFRNRPRDLFWITSSFLKLVKKKKFQLGTAWFLGL
jgi:hypothetical protein